MITVKIDDKAVKKLMASLPQVAGRAAEHALDQTAWAIYRAIGAEIVSVFDRPTPYTKRSLKVTKTKNHNMIASVWFKEPDRMEDHYLVPQVEGSERKLKGFERGLYKNKFIPSRHQDLDRYGNVSAGTLRQILSALGRAEAHDGYQANRTKKSARRNNKMRDRDYVWMPKGAGGGKMPPGVYRRVLRGDEISSKQKRFLSKQLKAGRMSAGAYQQTKGGSSFAKAKGLVPVLIVGRQHAKTQPRLKFYDIAAQVYDDQFAAIFFARFNSLVSK